jgi:glucokinase
MKRFYLGIDLGGSEVKLAVVDEKGAIIDKNSFSNNYLSTPKDVAAKITNYAKKLKGFGRVSATGIGVAGDIDQKTGVVRFSPNMKNWKNIHLGAMLKNKLPSPIVIDNDANAAALGAFWLDAKGAAKNLICITLGTGIGGGLIFGGKLYTGSTGSAGEIGHIPIDPYGAKCNCGNHGCIERYLGANYLSESARNDPKIQKSAIINKLVKGDLSAITPKILSTAALKGDKNALRVWKCYGEKLGIILSAVINLLNPDMIVLAGGVSKAGPLIMGPLVKTINDRAFKTAARKCKVIISHYTKRLGVVGSALLTKN